MTPRTTPPPLPGSAARTTPPPLPRLEPVVAAPPPRSHGRSLIKRALLGVALLFTLTMGGAWLMYASIDPIEEAEAAPELGRRPLHTVKSWGYQLQGVDLAAVAQSPVDLLVVDETVEASRRSAGSSNRPLAADLKQKPDGSRRLVVSYLSIGEAEDYRPYWQSSWIAADAGQTPAASRGRPPALVMASAGSTANPPQITSARVTLGDGASTQGPRKPSTSAPSWLGQENPEWRGNYWVRYWDPQWQHHIYGQAGAALDRIISAGFDGVYLDRADAYSHWANERPTSQADMIRLIADLAAYARRKKPGFVVILQNAEELLANSELRGTLDAVAKEDLFYGVDGAGLPNGLTDVTSSLRYLRQARRDGMPILVVEYIDEPVKIQDTARRIRDERFVPFFAPRALNALGTSG